MKLKVSIVKNGNVTHSKIVESTQEKTEYLALGQLGVFGTEYTVTEEDITALVADQERIAQKVADGEKAEATCRKVLHLIGGYNLSRQLTFGQKNQMKTTFADAKAALNDSQPGYAKQFIEAITPDEVLITAQMKADALSILADY